MRWQPSRSKFIVFFRTTGLYSCAGYCAPLVHSCSIQLFVHSNKRRKHSFWECYRDKWNKKNIIRWLMIALQLTKILQCHCHIYLTSYNENGILSYYVSTCGDGWSFVLDFYTDDTCIQLLEKLMVFFVWSSAWTSDRLNADEEKG